MESDDYYIQDSRQLVDGAILWWRADRCGYTTDIKDAGHYSKKRAVGQNVVRCSDIPWPAKYIDNLGVERVQFNTDIQETAAAVLGREGVELKLEPKAILQAFRCFGCGRFISEVEYYCAPCDNCTTINRP